MSSNTKLTVAFLEKAPRAAAAELQQLPVNESAALIESVPPRLSAPVVIGMTPWNAARLLETMASTRAAMIIRQLGFADMVSMARLIAAEARARIADELPGNISRRLLNALRYPPYQVGAWIDPEVPTLSADDTVADALRVLRTADFASHVFLEAEAHGEFLGVIAIRDVLQGDPGIRLGQLRRLRVEPVSNRASLASITFDERWDELIHLPVVGRRGNLLGGLARQSVRRGLHEQRTASAERNPSWLRELFDSYLATGLGVAQLLSRASPERGAATTIGASDER